MRGQPSASGPYELLLEAIDSGRLPPGSRLREVELAERFGISRTPVREALKRLEAQGLVSHEPHYGAVVATLDYNQTSDLYALREVLEGTAARLAAIHATEPEIELMQEMVENDRSLIGGDPLEMAQTNKRFHKQLHLSGRNTYLSTILDNLRLWLVLLAGTTLRAPNRDAESVREHSVIIDAIARHDADAADDATRTHIRNAFKARIQLNLEDEGGTTV